MRTEIRTRGRDDQYGHRPVQFRNYGGKVRRGIGAIKAGGLAPFAERFREAHLGAKAATRKERLCQ